MKYPDGYLWDYPGFPSLTVSYLKTNDFFYSGHVGFPTIFGLEHRKLGNTALMYFCFFTAILEAFTMVATHGHYIIDLLAGFVMGHYLSIMSDHITENYIDNTCIGFNQNETKVIEEEYKEVPTKDIENNS
jgi:hypothetical protein